MDKVFYAGNTIFEAFVQELLRRSIKLLLVLYLVTSGTCSTWARPLCLAEV